VGLRGVARERLGALAPIDAFRVVVAQARLSRPGLLVADDVLAALPPADLPTAVALLRGLADEGAAVLLALRDAAPVVAAGMAVRCVRLEAGRVVAIDGVDLRSGAQSEVQSGARSGAHSGTPLDTRAFAPSVSRLLELEVAPATPAQWRRLVATLPSMQAAGRRWRIPLEGRTPEQVLARCREAGIGVRGSQVVERLG
jgi:energy-coupling factor transporter ATP-binding protein EcfA2